jgi:uncharacterized protein YndB with AHSA1/START domain
VERIITLAVDVEAGADRVYDILTSTEGQRGFWTADCDVSATEARFGFPGVPVQLAADVTGDQGKLVRMRVRSGFPFWEGSTWEWELGAPSRAETGTSVLFRHHGFEPGYPELDLGHTAQTWAHVLDRLAAYAASGTPQPFFPAA